MSHKLSSDRSTAVSLTEEWLRMSQCPLGVKVQLLTPGRVGVYGTVKSLQELQGYLGWAPLPKEPAWLKG